jgi:hypothetical protein
MHPVAWSPTEDTMLEQPGLLLRPWAPAVSRSARAGQAAAADRTRVVLDAASGTPLGFAAWRPRPGWTWWRWLRRPVLEVYETEDESLLFQVHYSWLLSPRWQVQDAEARPIGILRCFRHTVPRHFSPVLDLGGTRPGGARGTWAQDRWGRVFGFLEQGSPPVCGWFLSQDGSELGALTSYGDDLLLTFTAELDGDPFAKMLLLASVLVRGDE